MGVIFLHKTDSCISTCQKNAADIRLLQDHCRKLTETLLGITRHIAPFHTKFFSGIHGIQIILMLPCRNYNDILAKL